MAISRTRKRLLAAGAAVVVVLLIIASTAGRKTKADAFVLKPVDLTYTILANCTVDYPKPLDMTFLREGVVRSVEVKDGDAVAKGQTLVRLDDFEARRNRDIRADTLRAAELRLKNAREEGLPNLQERLREFEVNLEQAQRTLKRYTDLEAAGGISKAEREKAEKEYQRALSQYNQQKLELESFSRSGRLADLESQVSIARAQLELAEKALADMSLAAPFPGTVLKVHVQPGEKATPSAKAVTIKENAAWQLVLNVDQKELPFLKEGLRAIVTLDAYPDDRIEGEVSYICTEVDKERSTCELRVEVKEDKPFIKSGMAGKAEILAETYKGVLAAPARFVKRDGAGASVWVWDGTKAELRQVAVRPIGERWVIIDGLPEGLTLLDADRSVPARRLRPGREVPSVEGR